MDLSARLRPIPRSACISHPTEHVWCGSPLRITDGWQLYASHWPKSAGYDGWVSHSRIVRYGSASIFGPWTCQGMVLDPPAPGAWDAHVAHNPMVVPWQRGAALFYMGTHGSNGADGPAVTPCDASWWTYRNAQRIGVALAKSPTSTFIRHPEPVIDVAPGWRARMTSNPAVAIAPDGRLRMVFKAVADGPDRFGGEVVHGVAEAETPDGPWTVHHDPVLRIPGVKFPAEDPFLWWQEGGWWMIAKDMTGIFTGAGTSLALFASDNGVSWRPAASPLVSRLELRWDDGTVESVQRLERPAIACDAGHPVALCVAVKTGEDTRLVQIPLAD
jgi:hypothetical protein